MNEKSQHRARARHVALAVTAVLLAACGGDEGDEGDGGGSSGGQVTTEWESYCVATFDQDYEVVDLFGERAFSIHPGDRYLLSSYAGDADVSFASIAYVTNAGPAVYDVEAPEGSAVLPFSSNCQAGATRSYVAAFTDVTVYASASFDATLCELHAGDALPTDPGSGMGYSLEGSHIGFSEPATYEVQLNAFGAQCGDRSSGFVSVPDTRLFGGTTWLVPLIGIVGPS